LAHYQVFFYYLSSKGFAHNCSSFGKVSFSKRCN
jgi:hypothetical protein